MVGGACAAFLTVSVLTGHTLGGLFLPIMLIVLGLARFAKRSEGLLFRHPNPDGTDDSSSGF